MKKISQSPEIWEDIIRSGMNYSNALEPKSKVFQIFIDRKKVRVSCEDTYLSYYLEQDIKAGKFPAQNADIGTEYKP